MESDSKIKLHTGRRIPIIGLGTWGLNKDTANTIVEALRMGYQMIDTSGDYGTQTGIGKGLKQSGIDRDEYYIVTKIENYEDALDATRKNLSELQLDYVDLMLIHHPPQNSSGEFIWDELIEAKRMGLVIDIGVSNYSEDQIQDLIDHSGITPVVNQIEWSPFGWSQHMLDYCRENKIAVQAYSPLTHARRMNNSEIEDIADEYNKSPAQILIRWCLQCGTIPIPKANSLDHLEENLDVFDFELSRSDIERLDKLNGNYSALSNRHFYAA